MTGRPPSGSMVHWRFRRIEPGTYVFGYVTWLGGDLVRMGKYNGDTDTGSIVNVTEIEWEEYKR